MFQKKTSYTDAEGRQVYTSKINLPKIILAVIILAALLAVNLTSKYTGLHLGFNLFNGLTAGILGVPGVVLLLLVQLVIT